MDNNNLYRGRKRHFRLSKSMGPNMWNFTVRVEQIPHMYQTDITDLMTKKETAKMPQSDMSSRKVEELFLGKVFYITFITFYTVFQSFRSGSAQSNLYHIYFTSE